MNFKLFIACAALSAAAATAQDNIAIRAAPGAPGDAMWIGSEAGAQAIYKFDAVLDGPGMRFEGEPVKDAPYSAEAVTESVQTLSDGNKIRRENRSLIYRDNQGRTRREESINALGPWATDTPELKTIFINDPVAGTHYVLNPADQTGRQLSVPKLLDHIKLAPGDRAPKVANRVVMRTQAGVAEGVGPGVGPGVAAGVKMRIAADAKKEELGTRSIEGVTAVGTKMTTTIPAELMGADRDIVITFERWHSDELKVDVMTKRSDPRVGETTYRLTNINRTEPLPGLFEPPMEFDITVPKMVEKMMIDRKMQEQAK